MRLLIGQISYLNSQPFYPLLSKHRLIPTPPHELGKMASTGEIDAGILATADYFLHEDRYEPAADLGVANHQEVRSILFLSRKPMSELNDMRIGITEETSTSVRLLRILLELKNRVRPKAYIRGLRNDADAFLVIGNEALRYNRLSSTRFPYKYDLATEWWKWKKLPFVFALWAIRRSLSSDVKQSFEKLLKQSLKIGMGQIDAIATEFEGKLGQQESLASYLRNFYYHLGPEELKGLQEFRRLLHEHNLLEPI